MQMRSNGACSDAQLQNVRGSTGVCVIEELLAGGTSRRFTVVMAVAADLALPKLPLFRDDHGVLILVLRLLLLLPLA